VPGPTGATGPAGGAIETFFSGLPIAITTLGIPTPGSPGDIAIIGKGESAVDVFVGPGNINIAGAPLLLQNLAISMPRDGVITNVVMYWSLVIGVTLLAPVNVYANIYLSPIPPATTPNNLFAPVGLPIPVATYPAAAIPVNDIKHTSVAVNIPFSTQDRILIAFYADSDETQIVGATLTAYASASLSIA
jgi:BclB C-terminal domain-containing protein